MKLADYLSAERGRCAAVAKRAQLAPAFLAQIANGTRPAPPAKCAAIEQATASEVMRWDLRPLDWWDIWPELVKAPGAPVPRDLLAPDRGATPSEALERVPSIAGPQAGVDAPELRPAAAIPGLEVRLGDQRQRDRTGQPKELRETILRNLDRFVRKER